MGKRKVKRMFAVTPSPPDERDLKYGNIVMAMEVPDELDLRDKMTKPRNQGSRGTCAAFSACAIKEYQERVDKGQFTDYMSPEFIYYYRNNKPGDGMNGRDVMDILKKFGSVPEDLYPYQSSNDTVKEPTPEILKCAADYRIDSYARVESIEDLKTALNVSGPCWISFPAYKHRPEMWRQSSPDEVRKGGHAMVVVGYTKEGFIIRNSWGSTWNGNGTVIYPYSDWGSHWEIWSLVDVKGSPVYKSSCVKCSIV